MPSCLYTSISGSRPYFFILRGSKIRGWPNSFGFQYKNPIILDYRQHALCGIMLLSVLQRTPDSACLPADWSRRLGCLCFLLCSAPSPLHCGSASGQGVCSSQAFRSDGIPQENHVSFLHSTLTALVCLWKGRLAVQFSDHQRERTLENQPGAKQSPL